MKKRIEMSDHHTNSHDDNVLVGTKMWIVVLFCMLCTCS